MYERLANRIGDLRWFRPVARRLLPPVDLALSRLGWRATPWPTLVLTTTGRQTGQRHRAPLYFVDTGMDRAVVATNYGGPEPQWSRNLRHDPRCEVTLNRKTMPAMARLASGDEAEELFGRFAEFYGGYEGYRARADREIPIWVLAAVTGEA